MKRTNKANGIRSAVPRLTDYMRSSMGVIILALSLVAVRRKVGVIKLLAGTGVAGLALGLAKQMLR